MDDKQQDQAAKLVSAALDDLAAQLIMVRGLHPDLVLAGLHSSALALIATSHGGDVATQCARESADKVEHLPSHDDCRLAAAPVAGRA
ncbi:hypothetical protein [Alkalilacustris brevis]|uniref:hypothetical protein n=1 Tax=Alkalilacustris brevis TaxID=2026338 RepID=UPI000E0D64EB|nr:hypothetical protein [Alkalilacustris brevis]